MISRVLTVALLILGLAGCGTIFEPDPVGIGKNRDDLKQSPCACFELRQHFAAWHSPA